MKTSDPNSFDVFLSYSQRDQSWARSLSVALRERGLRVWDDSTIAVGESWLSSIEHALKNSNAFVFVVSPELLKSNWDSFELGVAIGKQAKIIPLLLDESAIPPFLARRQGLDARNMPIETIATQVERAVRADTQ